MIAVTSATYDGGHRLKLQFSDGRSGTVDLRVKIFGDRRAIVGELRDVNAFRRFRVDLHTVVWENGFDLAPEFLYDQIRLQGLAPPPERSDLDRERPS
jgi:hypothetical protein